MLAAAARRLAPGARCGGEGERQEHDGARGPHFSYLALVSRAVPSRGAGLVGGWLALNTQVSCRAQWWQCFKRGLLAACNVALPLAERERKVHGDPRRHAELAGSICGRHLPDSCCLTDRSDVSCGVDGACRRVASLPLWKNFQSRCVPGDPLQLRACLCTAPTPTRC